jgi:hypothetical protein
MTKKLAALLLVICLTFGTTGCSVITSGESSWEVYGGVRTKQISDEPGKVEVKSTLVDKLIDMFSFDGDSEKE